MNTRLKNISLGVQEIKEHDGSGTDVCKCLALCTTNEIRKKKISICYLTCVDGKSKTGT